MKTKTAEIFSFLVMLGFVYGGAVGPLHAFPFDFLKPKEKEIELKPVINPDMLRNLRTLQCSQAYQSWQEINEECLAKKAVCAAFEQAQAQKEKYNTIAGALFALRKSNLSDLDNDCRDFLKQAEQNYRDQYDEASNTFLEKWEECHGSEGPSLGALQSARQQAEEATCEACNNNWPGETSIYIMDPCASYRNPVRDLERMIDQP